MDDHAIFMERIRALLARLQEEGHDPSLAEVEDALTSGYAHAHALEAERWRIQRRIGEVAAQLARADVDSHVDDLDALRSRMTQTEGELLRLRRLLRPLRNRASELRAAA